MSDIGWDYERKLLGRIDGKEMKKCLQAILGMDDWPIMRRVQQIPAGKYCTRAGSSHLKMLLSN